MAPTLPVATIPFYLYPFSNFPLSWGPTSDCRHDIVRTPKHDHAEFAWNAMMRHPWRTSDASSAKLAILPISFDLHARSGCAQTRTIDDLVLEMAGVINKSKAFPGIRHVVIMNDWKATQSDMQKMAATLSPVGIIAGMEGRGNCRTSLGYTSNYAMFSSLRNPNSKFIPNPDLRPHERIFSVHTVVRIDRRKAYSDRVALFRATGKLEQVFMIAASKVKIDGARECRSSSDHDRCVQRDRISRASVQHAAERSNFTLCFRGDTLGSDRWINAMTAGTALIYVVDSAKDLEWLPFPSKIPWGDFVITILRDAFLRDPIGAIKAATNISSVRLEELQRISRHYAVDLDWTAHNSRTLVNFLDESLHVPCTGTKMRPSP